MVLQIFILLVGLLLILFGANWLVDGSSSIAKRFGISEFVIGLTIVGIGTSTPEMVVSFLSSFQGKADMAIGNIVGSNIFNTMMILGVTALIAPLAITKSNLKKDIPLNIIVTLLLIILGMNFTLFGKGEDQLSRLDGVILLGVFAWYIWSSFRSDNADPEEDGDGIKEYKTGISVLLIVAGLAGLIIGGRLFVNSATELAKMFGVSDKFIAITVMVRRHIYARTCNLRSSRSQRKRPACFRKRPGFQHFQHIAYSGGAALINPLSFSGMTYVDLGAVLLSALFILGSAYLFKKKQLDRFEGAILLLMEAAYMWYLIANL